MLSSTSTTTLCLSLSQLSQFNFAPSSLFVCYPASLSDLLHFPNTIVRYPTLETVNVMTTGVDAVEKLDELDPSAHPLPLCPMIIVLALWFFLDCLSHVSLAILSCSATALRIHIRACQPPELSITGCSFQYTWMPKNNTPSLTEYSLGITLFRVPLGPRNRCQIHAEPKCASQQRRKISQSYQMASWTNTVSMCAKNQEALSWKSRGSDKNSVSSRQHPRAIEPRRKRYPLAGPRVSDRARFHVTRCDWELISSSYQTPSSPKE
ncbi:hypothetical protein B0T20DRAFT_416808 [Sordaria brevicollis]|uniref:Uncharacterized protein n=1 Tax=Sordaria brevicollis TaxID=83679 RepID=A0AAE0PA30_SORBR|nr:hypothetical protein B0T20DRAFT_416808 [Sordaria brevicollis]